MNKKNINSLILFHFKTKLISLERRLDKMSMAGSVEFRVPYLHEKVFELSKKIPVKYYTITDIKELQKLIKGK